ncbi:geranylgeranylglycerol-phosphate geranylgeranyltransferase [Kordia sp. YSTF-M3]|uniref:Geranylgeranylglycerol-phosphate geranylgeranyltransferase n=1 Tax=Kordia aestuariivivens TaxID=2759037 RepID=A0ABR7Q640_9FLAO|nr:geranylgeranylglycerol-phosphate geranylgeranyltransferase [Kordia aestuariivivens]MBC8754032.1 geranylgeranylglycerol-phosphate geranylgeranyltransferase [Kordia aestuariivivens]
MLKFLQLIRFPNLVMIALTQFLFFYYWIVPFDDCHIKSDLFLCVMIATIFIAAGGNIINDIFDVKTDRINKPNRMFIDTFISKKKAYLLYSFLTFVGIGLGSYAGFAINHSWVSLIFIGIAVLLFLYSSYLKGIPLVGNSVVSALVASSLFILIAFDKGHTTRGKHLVFFKDVALIAIYIYGTFAFWINLMRELVKDIEDVNGDYNAGINTLPIILGRNRVNKIVAVLAGLMICFILYITSAYLQGKTITTIYVLITILLPLLYFIMKIWQADSKREYRMLSLLLKLIMLFGILSTLIFYYFDPIDKLAFLLP